MLSGHDIVCISSIDWDFIWQGHQEIMATLAEEGNRVLFIENTGVRAPRLRDLPRVRQRIRNWLRSVKGFRQERENLFVYSPLLLPFPYSRLVRWLNRTLLFSALNRWMRAMGFRCGIVWTFLPTPLSRDLIRELDPELTVYYCIDDLASSSPAARRIARSETGLFREADLVFVTSERLRQKAARFTDAVHVFPFGVAFEKFERIRRSPDTIPQDLQRLPRPVVGYVGGVHQWIDQELLASVAGRMPNASFVLVGPPQTDVSRLAKQPNVHLLGARSHEDIPAYIKGFDVGIIPYHLSEYTAHVYPTKLNEYLAMGIPVVATELPEVLRFNGEYGGVAAVAGTAQGFSAAIAGALAQNAPEAVARRIDVSKQNSWAARIAQMSALIERNLTVRRGARPGWQESLRRLYRAARRRAIRIVVGTAAVYVVLFQSPFLWWVAEPLRMAEPARPADAIVVFAGGVGESGKAGGGYQERVKQAVELYHQGRAPAIIFSSGYTFAFQEAEVMRQLAVAHGVPPSAIVLETEAKNTFENVAFVARIVRRSQWQTILLVSSPYHMRRAMWTFRRAAPSITVIPTPVASSQFYSHIRGASVEQIRGILHEYLSILYYWSKGWI